jgi:hypothetical protein
MGVVVEAGAVVQQGLTALIPPTLRPPIDDAPIVAPCTPACTVALRSEAARGCEDVGLRPGSAETPGVSAPKFEWNVGREVVPPWSESGSERGCRNRQRPLRGRGSAISRQRRYVSRPTFRKRAQCNAAFCTAGGRQLQRGRAGGPTHAAAPFRTRSYERLRLHQILQSPRRRGLSEGVIGSSRLPLLDPQLRICPPERHFSERDDSALGSPPRRGLLWGFNRGVGIDFQSPLLLLLSLLVHRFVHGFVVSLRTPRNTNGQTHPRMVTPPEHVHANGSSRGSWE